ncbi:dolichyl-phosphate-mannose--protein mannosyltransferase [Allonocardiopsis opalescens]|uniref:Polyprenol-phosphate-mannose--protein mannosyltransferase n=1 Tax=Allonocardiopsis opalescens TaxID=1144618 RepID=A0A2T0Q964_9ACTN|nr:dolichyl-phosphate-mannose-protein mannosyltransferase [Allonocardiopsis opalescens]
MTVSDVDEQRSEDAPPPRQDPPPLRERLVSALPGGLLLGWLGPILVAAFAGALRFIRLGDPPEIMFDETYYAKDAFGLLRFGAEHETVEGADDLLNAGNAEIFGDGGAFVVHPPVGKWIIAAGEWAFGMTPFGWRFGAALIGALSVLLIARIARRMTRSTLLGCVAGLLLALDGLHFTLSRIALLDIFLMFWILAAFGCLVVDRDRTRARLAARMEGLAGARRMGPWLGVRWWRVAAAVCMGLAVGTKWSALFYVAAFGLLTVAWDYGARRSSGLREPGRTWFLLDAVPAFFTVMLVGFATYLATWTGWFLSSTGWGRDAVPVPADSPLPGPLASALSTLQALARYHVEAYSFHSGLDSDHDYQSTPWQWPLLLRPIIFWYRAYEPGQNGCAADRCSQAVLALGNPAIWWAAIPALIALWVWWLIYRDWRAGSVLLGYAAGWLPWFAFPDRTMFFFYAAPMLPFMVLALTLVIGAVVGPGAQAPRWSPMRRMVGASVAGTYLLLVIAVFYYFYPVLAGEIVPWDSWNARMWLQSWI